MLLLIYDSLEYELIAKGDMIVFEATWQEIKDNMDMYAKYNKFIHILDTISTFKIFKHLNKKELVSHVSHMKFKKYTQRDIILKYNQKVKDFYLIYKGTIKITKEDNKKIREIETGNSFGEMRLIDNQPIPYNIIAKSKNLTLVLLPQKKFDILLNDPIILNYIKEKMCLETTNIKLTDLYYLSYLGRGKFGNVCLVHNEVFFYAAKAISKTAAERQKFGVKYLLSEKKTMKVLDHPFIVKYVTTLKTDTWCFILQEFINGMVLSDYINSKKTVRNLAEVKFISAILFIAIDYMHRKRIVHRDLKPSNVMIDKTGYLKLIDFGASKKLKGISKTVIGTPNFIAPEVLLGKGYCFQSDYWSIGVIIYQAFYGILPFGNNITDLGDTYKEILHKELTFPNKSNREVNSLISSLLTKDTANRYGDLKMVKSHLIFKDFCWEDLISMKMKPLLLPNNTTTNNNESPERFKILNSPFMAFMANEKIENNTTITLRIDGQSSSNVNTVNANVDWFADF